MVIHDKYETTVSQNWGEVARTLRTLYQLGQGEFAHKPKAAEQTEPMAAEPVPLDLAQTELHESEVEDKALSAPEFTAPADSGTPSEPVVTTEPVAFYPANQNNLPYDVVVERIRTTPPEPEQPPAKNFRITDEHLGEGGPKQKYARNIEAICTLQAIEAEGRSATPEEQEALSQYVGWGGLADAFDPEKDSWAKEYKELKSLLSEDEYAAARASTLNAHYTSPTVIRAIYDTVERMGFTSGNILEPSCGVGNFFGMLPESMVGSRLYGVELDSITGRIARQLYPEVNITVAGFETTKQRDFYDLAVGNVPFGNYKVNDKAYNQLGFSIHNYFFAKALDQVRPGGIVAFVTSHFTMDSKDSSARKYVIFKDPSEDVSDPEAGWQTADEYLSGNVRNKLQIAKFAAENNPAFAVNVEALTKAQPKELEASEIDVRLGATWILPDIIQKFMNETFQIPFYLRYAIRVKFSPATAEWRIEGKTKTNCNDVMAYETFGTARANAYKILEDTLNLRDVRVYDTVEDENGKPKRVLNKKETMLAGQKRQAIKDAFAN